MNIDNPKKLGQFIRSERKRLKVTQKQLAMASGTNARFVIDLESGKATCHIGKVLLVLRNLGLKVQIEPS
jgi:HTH-type transcriptional regulator / antitoxin HipB